MAFIRTCIFAVCVSLALAKEDGCGECITSDCPKTLGEVAQSCLSSKVVRDRCNCCYVCAQAEGEACDLDDSPKKFGECGFNLACKDREDGTNAGICKCLDQRKVCATNGITYNNTCKLRADSVRLGDPKLIVDTLGECKKAPKIISKPKDTKNLNGSDVALLCEASGNPLPYMLWLYTRADGETENMPGSDSAVSVIVRGGPEAYQITSYLQIQGMQKKHEGDYTCLIKSTEGDEQAVARLKVDEFISMEDRILNAEEENGENETP